MATSADSAERADRLPIGAAVEELRRGFPDVSHSSLRFLEREGFIEPFRTPGGHRLYTAADLDRIRRIKEWQLRNYSLDEIRNRLTRFDQLPAVALLTRRFLDVLVSLDFPAARQLVIDADDNGMSLEAIFGEVMQPALYEVGVHWERGDLLVAEEKQISEATRDLIAELSARHARAVSGGPDLIAACVEGERHELGLRMICGLLRARGRPVRYLGADVAPSFLAEAVHLRQPEAMLLSAKLAPNLRGVEDSLNALRRAPGERLPFPLLVGGQIATTHEDVLRSWGAIPILEERPGEAVRAIESLLAPLPAGT